MIKNISQVLFFVLEEQIKKNENDDAMKIIDSIVSRVSNDEKIEKRLSFKNMRKTTNSSENNILPGIRKLG